MILHGSSFSLSAPDKQTNEDAVLGPIQLQPGRWVAAVADGVGGHFGGAVASRAAIEVIKSRDVGQEADIESAFAAVQQHLKLSAEINPELERMATTLSAIWLAEFRAFVGHVGDTRIYHLRAHGLMNRTVDQTEAQRLVRDGILTPARAKKYPRRNVLLSALTAKDDDFDLFVTSFEVRPGDRLLLISDGVYNNLTRGRISDISLASNTIEAFCRTIRQDVEARGAKDDYSAVCIQVD